MLTAWNAFSSLDRLIENVMDDVMTAGFGTTVRSPALTPPVDIRTNEGEIVFSMDLHNGSPRGLVGA